ALERMGGRWQDRGVTPEDGWKNDSARYIHDFPVYQAISWIDNHDRVRRIYPLAGRERFLGMSMDFEEQRRATLTVARTTRSATVSHSINLLNGGLGFFVCVPVFKNNQH